MKRVGKGEKGSERVKRVKKEGAEKVGERE